MALLTAALALAALSWLLPLVVATRDARVPVLTSLSRFRDSASRSIDGVSVCRPSQVAALAGACALAAALAGGGLLGAPYSAERPQRLMLFHTRRTLHARAAPVSESRAFYWAPELDANTRAALQDHGACASDRVVARSRGRDLVCDESDRSTMYDLKS